MSIAEQHVSMARALARRWAHDAQDYDEVLGDAMLGLARAEVEWDGVRPFGPLAQAWIVGQIRRGRRARTGIRRDCPDTLERQPPLSLDWAPIEGGEPAVNAVRDKRPEPADAAQARALWDAVDQLPDPRQRTIVRLYYQFDYSQHEIARHIGVSQMHVSRLLRAAIASLAGTHALAA